MTSDDSWTFYNLTFESLIYSLNAHKSTPITYLWLHFFFSQFDEGHSREVHGICTRSVIGYNRSITNYSYRYLWWSSTQIKLDEPFSSRCSWPVFVEATTLAAISFTCREACWRTDSFLLLRSALTWLRGRELRWDQITQLMHYTNELSHMNQLDSWCATLVC